MTTHLDFEKAAREYMSAKAEVDIARQEAVAANAKLDAAAKRCSAAETEFGRMSREYAASIIRPESRVDPKRLPDAT